MPEIFNDFRLQ